MRTLTFNFLKADLRMPQLMFWDWLFPLVLILAFSVFIQSQEFSSFLLPGLVSLFIMQSIIFSLPYRIAQFQEQGILALVKERGNPVKLLTGFYLSRFVILVVQTVAILVIGAWLLKVPLELNIGLMVVAFVAATLLFMLLATCCGIVMKKQNAALGLSQAIYFVLIGTSGIFYPMEKSPELLQLVSGFSPLYYVNELWTGALLGDSVGAIRDIGILAIFTVILLILSGLLLRNKRKGKRKYEGIAQAN